jgi:hypothetical protein
MAGTRNDPQCHTLLDAFLIWQHILIIFSQMGN